jgi:hypothetical protein
MAFWEHVESQIWQYDFLRGVKTLLSTTPGCERLPTTVDRSLIKPLEAGMYQEDWYDNPDMSASLYAYSDCMDNAGLDFELVWWSPVTNIVIRLEALQRGPIVSIVWWSHSEPGNHKQAFRNATFDFTPEQNLAVINTLLALLEQNGLITRSSSAPAAPPAC